MTLGLLRRFQRRSPARPSRRSTQSPQHAPEGICTPRHVAAPPLRPRLVRRLMLAGTAPQGGPDLHRWSENVYALATPDLPTAEDLLTLFFSESEQSRARGMESIGRLYQREVDRDEPTDLATRDAQL